MRSATYLSLAELCLALDGNPWTFAGINRFPETKTPSQEERYTMELPWQTKAGANNATPAGSNSRDAVRKALTSAERKFIQLCQKYPAPEQIQDEYHRVKSPHRTQHSGFVIKPRYSVDVVFGTRNLVGDGSDSAITKEVDSAIQDRFIFTNPVTVPDDTLAEDVHIYLTSADGDYSGDPGIEHEIRPVEVSIDSSGGAGNWTAQVSIPAYLCVKPSLYTNQSGSLPHESATYIDNVVLYVESIDVCDQGYFRSKKRSNGRLTDVDTLAEFVDDGNEYYLVEPITCTDGLIYGTVLRNYPDSIHLNYVSGFARENGRVNQAVVNVLWKLTLGYLEFDEERSITPPSLPANPLWTGKARAYRQMQQIEKRRDNIGNQVGTEWMVLVRPDIQQYLTGLTIRRGPVEAIGEMLDNGWIRQSVHT